MTRHPHQDEIDMFNRAIYECSEIEREAERLRQFVKIDGLWYRFFTWIATKQSEKRNALRRERDRIMY